ncbi:hypothetical protein ACIQU5_25880 [Streptomyces sp. NPDC090306]|uniref:hypothetical protein n=1 Tax=unclassified Streptomyces TaxID=2593676 RepID=UPI0036E7EABD
MSTLPVAKTTPPTPAGPRRDHPTRGLFVAELRLQRRALYVWSGFVVLVAALLLWLYGPGADATQKLFDAYGYAGVQKDAWSRGVTGDYLSTTYNDLFYDGNTLITLASFLVALYAAATLTSRELVSGTVRLAWSQGISPARWLTARLAVPAAAITVGTGLLVALYRLLWSAHSDLLLAGIGPRQLYFTMGIATVAAPLFGLAVGVFSGLLLRRPVPALVLAGLVQYVALAVRRNFWPVQRAYETPELTVRSRVITSSGARIPDPGCYDNAKCLARHDVVGFTRTYLPSPDYWPRQLAETGILLGLAALAVAGAFLLLRRRAV